MSVIGSNIIAGASGTVETGYQISRSLRFNSADTAYLTRTQSDGNRRTWHFKTWVKRSKLGTKQNIFGHIRTSPSNVQTYLSFLSGDTLEFFVYSGTTTIAQVTTTQVFRDVSAYMQIDLAVDTTQATASNRVKLFVNGTQITALSTATYMAQNYDTFLNEASQSVGIGRVAPYDTSEYSDFYLSDVHFIDGQALTPSDFGQTDSATGVWVPKAYTGTYGTNGFWLKFDDNSGITSTTLGKDSSGNSNNWTPNNFSVTAGAGNDSLVDSPTNYGTDTGAGGEVRGNYATLNPLNSGGTLANGNLQMTGASAAWRSAYGTVLIPTTGKWYWEVVCGSQETIPGIASASSNLIGNSNSYPADTIISYSYYGLNGNKYTGPGNTSAAYGATFTTNDVIGVALDSDAGTLVFYKNGVSQGTAFTGLTSQYVPVLGVYNNSSYANFGQRPFAYTAPSGFKALCTTNLPTPAIGASASTLASKNFNAVLWTGNGTNPVTVSGVGFQPDVLWGKSRSNAYHHRIADAVRGVGSGKMLYTSLTDAEGNNDAYGYISSFNSDGFVATAGATNNEAFNTNAATYVGWAWNAGGSTVTNTNGTISSQVRANQTAGISIVGYTGTGANATVGHGLGVAPKLIIFKDRTSGSRTGDQWPVYHASLGATKQLYLNATGAAGTASTVFNDTAPTSSVFSVGSWGGINYSGDAFIAYAFAEVAGFSKFGSYTGNGSADGPFVYCGFRPRFILIKGYALAGAYWIIIDTVRDTYNVAVNKLGPNVSDAENSVNLGNTTQNILDVLSNGFKLRSTTGDTNNGSQSYVFAAFAESPFNYARAR